MAQVNNFRIILIDDNPNIHSDFIKILSLNKNDKNLDDLESKLFGDGTKPAPIVQEKTEDTIDKPIFEIDTASQGQEGVEKIRLALEEGRPFALAFVDIRMPPGWDGVETIKHIWKIDKDIQVVICTAYSDYTWEETVKELGMGDNLLILKKPFDNTAVRQLACALTKKWILLQENRAHTQELEKQVEERTNLLQESVSEIRATLESSADGILVVTNKGNITDYNKKFAKMWDVPFGILETKKFESLLQWMSNRLGETNKLNADVQDLEDKPAQIRCAELNLDDGQIFEYYTQPHELRGKIVGRVWSFRDVTHRVYLEKKLEFQATHDSLTNLPNRLLLIDRLKHAITDCERKQKIFAVLFFDLDRFKVVNDSLSHSAGDELLSKVSKRVEEEIRDSDTLARLGGDEFVLIMPDIRDEALVVEIVTRLLEAIAKPFQIAGRTLHITTSIGISIYPKDGKTADELLRNADLAMYIAKREGLNKFQFYEKRLNEESLIRLEKEIELRRAIDNEEFILHYQPQIDSSTGTLIAVEALVRWDHPTQGLISPIEFVPVAEDTELMIEIGRWIFTTACKQNKAWQDAGLPKIRMALNVSNKQINDKGFIAMLDEVLKTTGLEPQYLEIEITEDIVISNDKVVKVINQISDRGVRVAFDDFGTGNSSLNYLRMVPINQLKIDQSFVKNINKDNKSDEVIIRAIIALASDLKLDVVAEGVETTEQLDFLNKYDCHDIQGYYFSKPLDADGVIDLFTNGINGVSLKAQGDGKS
jgi:diguanylate cyclase (GGDEF)-like protein